MINKEAQEILDTIRSEVEDLYRHQYLDTGNYESLMATITELETELAAQVNVVEENAREEAEA